MNGVDSRGHTGGCFAFWVPVSGTRLLIDVAVTAPVNATFPTHRWAWLNHFSLSRSNRCFCLYDLGTYSSKTATACSGHGINAVPASLSSDNAQGRRWISRHSRTSGDR